jgi:hypothetical protein
MGNNNQIRVVLGSLRYKSAPNTDFSFKVPLVQNTKQNVEFDTIVDVNLQQVYDDERQASTLFRPSTKFSVIFKNSYAGTTNYEPFQNNMYYINAEEAAIASCPPNPNVSWTGLPQYNEFDFIRTDYYVTGYTQPPNNHLLFVPNSASTYNWNFFVSYPFQNDPTKQLQAVESNTQITLNWVSGDGIPFVVQKTQQNGRNLITFRCPVKHGLNTGEFVKLSFPYNGEDIFQVDSLGINSIFDSEFYVFNLADIGYTGTTFNNGTTGTFKRIILDSNTGDTVSKYYIRKHKIMTNVNDSVLTKAGFEQNIFGVKKKFESAPYTPNKVERVSIKEGGQSYTLSFNRDIDLLNLNDNLGRPISELFFTAIWKGYFGWTTGTIKQGYEFNLPLNTTTGQPSQWWDLFNSSSDTAFNTLSWSNLGNVFNYVESVGDNFVMDGDYCEWNDYEQTERVISNMYHKIKFDTNNFNISSGSLSNPLGYYYKPLHSLKIRQYSNYIEFADTANIVDLPNYAYFSTSLSQFIWRDLYSYGFIDTEGNGVNYPFLNGGHYPYSNIIFRIIPEGTNYNEEVLRGQPIIDECE